MAGLFDDPEAVARLLPYLTPEQLRSIPHETLYRARYYAAPEHQSLISPFEHRAYAKEVAHEKPWMAPGIALLAPAYQGAKWAGLTGSRSDASWDQVTEAYGGLWQGLMQRLKESELNKAFTSPFKDK
jgi:hypothetical protein